MTSETGTERRTRAALEASVEHLDARVRSRLTQARHAALDELGGRAHHSIWWRLMAPAAAFSAAAAVAIVLWTQRAGEPAADTAAPMTAMASVPSEDLDLVLGEDPFDSALRYEAAVDPAT